jgi:hypothetical protein
MSHGRWAWAIVAVGLVAGWGSPPARGDVFGLAPGDSLSDPAGPMQIGTDYSGAFRRPDDMDYVRFSVAAPGTVLRFVVKNTYDNCPADSYCPMWGTLIDTAGRQLGGEGSGAGTGPVGPGDSDSILWTFPEAGDYLLVLEGNGDLDSYRFRGDDVTATAGAGAGGSRGGSGTQRTITHLRAAGHQRGTGVLARLTLRPAATGVQAALLGDARRLGGAGVTRVGYLRRGHLGPGVVALRVPLFPHVRRMRRNLRLTLVVRVRRRGVRAVVLRRTVWLASRTSTRGQIANLGRLAALY